MLAYLDNILEPDDAQDIGKKIEESEYATGLVHRIRDVMRRLRLGAPDVGEGSSKDDPNTVAEYLDNTLASDDVTAFEKVCLESDVELAEVGSCHQILTLVLGEPAEIDPDSRQRMYQIGNAPAGSGPPPTPAMSTTTVIASEEASTVLGVVGREDFGERKSRPKPTVPEYLREPRRRRHWFSLIAALVLIVCFSVFVLAAMHQFSPGTSLGDALVQLGLRAAPKPATEIAAATKPVEKEIVEKPAENGTEANKSVESPAATPAADAVAKPHAESSRPPVPAPAVASGNLPTEGLSQKPTGTTAEPPATEHVAPVPATPSPSPAAKMETKVEVKPETSPMPGKELQKLPASESVATLDHLPAPKMKTADSDVPKTAPLESSKAAPPPVDSNAAPLPPEPLARLMSNEQVLLKNDPKAGWVRVGANQMLMPQQLLVLPTYRAKVTLTVGVTLEILGGTKLELLPSSTNELPGIRILYGRVVLMPLAQPGSRLRIAFGDRSGVLTFSDPDSVAAFDVRRLYVSGSNPENGPPHTIADLYARAGDIVWDEIGGKLAKSSLRLASPQKISFNAGLTSEATAVKDMPKWIVGEPLRPLDHRASVAIEESLPPEQPARLGLMELSTRPQKEVRWLTMCCLGYLGQYRDMVAVLDDPAHKLDWADYIAPLRDGIVRDAESAAGIREALEKQYPQKASELYRLLWGYSDDDLRSGADAELVKSLDDDSLAIRVLSFWNLKELTGLGLFYRPELPIAKRQQPINRWNERLKAGEIRVKTAAEKGGDSDGGDVAPLPPGPAGK
jgi:hypothetical protein